MTPPHGCDARLGSPSDPHGDPPHRDRPTACAQIVLARAAEYNTITPALRDELAAAIDDADADRDVRVILLRAEGPAFCAGYGLDWSTAAQADESKRIASGGRVWDSVADLRMMGTLRRDLHEALVRAEADDRGRAGLVHRRRHRHGALRRHDRRGRERDLRLSAGARLGHADDGDVGLPDGARAREALSAHGRRDPARKAASSASSSRSSPTPSCTRTRSALARAHGAGADQSARDAEAALQPDRREHGLRVERLLGTLFDGVARHTQEGLDFVRRADDVGFRQAVRERDDPFGDYGSRAEASLSRLASSRFPDRAAAARRRRMGRFITLAMCGVILVGVAGCAKRCEQKAERQQAKADAEAAKYPPPPAKSKMAQITAGHARGRRDEDHGPAGRQQGLRDGQGVHPVLLRRRQHALRRLLEGQGRVIFQGGNAWGAGRGKVVRVDTIRAKTATPTRSSRGAATHSRTRIGA